MEEEFVVEAILKRRYNEINKRYEWKVKWEGWDMDNCTWEPIENLEHNTVFLSYMEKKSSLMKTSKRYKLEDRIQQRNQEENVNLKQKEPLKNHFEGDLEQFRKQGTRLITQNKNIIREKKPSLISPLKESPVFSRVLQNIKRNIKLKNPLTQQLLNILQMVDTHVELVKTLMYQQNQQAQQILCHLLLVGKNPRLKISWYDPIIWFAVSTDNGLFMFYPINSRIGAEHWLDECTDFSMPIIPVSKQKLLELTENGETLVTYATGN